MQLGAELRRLREKAGLTLVEAVDGLALSTTKVHRVENGLTAFKSTAELRLLLERYGVEDEEDIEFLTEIQRDSLNRGWWSQYRSVMPSGMEMYVGLEAGAKAVRAWHPSVVIGLLQTERYVRAMLEVAKPVEETTTEFVERIIQLRMERKDQLVRRKPSPELWAILDEAALRKMVGSADVMREQYEEIIRLTKLDNVTVQILPMASSIYRSSFNFNLLDFEAPALTVVQTDLPDGSNVSDKQTTVWAFTRRFDALRAGALAPGETPTFLHRLAGEI
ncbi:helix-turn-helix transcriptional regulator [Actinacidiphila sp. DG2A-62]|uniref:helix-turn-helix domain-containing protein n=1 Tax=Actinacidiphila sp. DG2A-62 TaxID=3108821 RepID=UPI002DB86B81|nr:helix-turn-helix transcriptional regulator [Actinacidiphila sp. DG2A-62]MEC3996393.1 helix-turn-helix transcriptional regulator [Actinacidiphila sp. DG2A-62]